MGIFDLFKKKIEKKTIKSDEINDFITKKSEELASVNDLFLKEIIQVKEGLIIKLKANLSKIKNIDFSEKKVDPRTEFIIRQNLNNFIFYLDKLIFNLDEINGSDPIKYYEDLNSIIFTFEKRSQMSFEKATFIFGELGPVRENLDNFFSDLKRLIKEKTDFINTKATLDSVKGHLDEINKIKNNIFLSNNEIKNIDSQISIKKEFINEIESTIDSIKDSESYLGEVSRKKDYLDKLKEYDKSIMILKSMIDFKTIASIFHSSKDSMEHINLFKQNFKEYFDMNSNILLELLNDSKLLTDEIRSIIENLVLLRQKINNINLIETESLKIKSYIETIKTLNYDVIGLKDSIERENKKQEKYNSDIIKNKEDIVKELEKINIIVN